MFKNTFRIHLGSLIFKGQHNFNYSKGLRGEDDQMKRRRGEVNLIKCLPSAEN